MAKVLCFDPSGNYHEGNGTTGWAIFQDGVLVDFGAVEAEKYTKQELYWDAVSDLVIHNDVDILLCESYKLFEHKAKAQSWSALETSQLIGYLRMICFHNGITYMEQDPANKVRVADPQLEHMGFIQKKGRNYICMNRSTSLHMRDAIRHGIFFHRYGKGKSL